MTQTQCAACLAEIPGLRPLLLEETAYCGECGSSRFCNTGYDGFGAAFVSPPIIIPPDPPEPPKPTGEQRAAVDALEGQGFTVAEYESSWALDEDGCFELCVMSQLNCYEQDPHPEMEAMEHRLLMQACKSSGIEVVGSNAATWEGWSDYTPDPGNCRRLRVRLASSPV